MALSLAQRIQGIRFHETAKRFPAIDKAVVLSPHSDDAAFSIPGTLCQLTAHHIPVELVTCFSFSAFVKGGRDAAAETITALRKKEDQRYMATVGPLCNSIWLDLRDAPLRGYELSSVCDRNALSRGDFRLVTDIFERVRQRLFPGSALFVPLGIGDHVDHRIVHEAGKRFVAEHAHQIIFYEEIPYSLHLPPKRIAQVAQRTVHSAGCDTGLIFTAGPNLLSIKVAAAQCYPTQIEPAKAATILQDARHRVYLSQERLWECVI